MSVPLDLAMLAGEWVGTSQLWLSPDEPPGTSGATMSMALVARGQTLLCRYTWAVDGSPEEGVMLLSLNEEQSQASAAWTDSWHLHDTLMVCLGEMRPDGGVTVTGSYAAPPGPDWGWSIGLELHTPESFRMVMHNISPEGTPALAWDATYERHP